MFAINNNNDIREQINIICRSKNTFSKSLRHFPTNPCKPQVLKHQLQYTDLWLLYSFVAFQFLVAALTFFATLPPSIETDIYY